MRTTDTRIYPFAIAAGGMQIIPVSGAKFLVRSTTGPVNVRWQTGFLANLEAGQGYNVRDGFAQLTLTNDGAGAIAGFVQVADDDFIDNRIAGEVALNIRTTYAQTAPAVGLVSSVLLAANTSRKYVLVQNNHATATIYLGFGIAATVAGGLKVGPGGFYESGLAVHSGAINVIGDAANTAVVVVEG